MNLPFANLRHLKRVVSAICLFCVILLFLNVRHTAVPVGYTWLLGKNMSQEFSPTHVTWLTPEQVLNSLKPCPENLTDSVGAIQVDRTVPSWKELRAKYIKSARSLPQTYSGSRINDSLRTWLFVHNFSQGGTPSFGLWSPVECRPRQTVAVIIPFRDREAHLRVFLNHMHTLFRHQQLLYSIFVIEQIYDWCYQCS